MATPAVRRYPLDALVCASGLSEAALGRKVRLSGTTLKLARERGLTEAAADRYAVRAGLTPWMVWDDWLSDLERECAAAGCGARFVRHPQGMHRRFCSDSCRRREGERRARELGMPSAERKRAYRRRYYAENGDYERARQRRYDRARRGVAA